MIGDKLCGGRYQIIEELGKGGMGAVYKGYDQRLDREVAIKVLLPGHIQDSQFIKRFEREAFSVAKLSHTNIVKIFDYGNEEGIPYLVMEYVDGGTLKDKIGEPISWPKAVRDINSLAKALEYAHQLKVIHRDIKPSNFLLTRSGDLMISDFGITKLLIPRI